MIEIRKEAELIIKQQQELLDMPNGMPSVNVIIEKSKS